MGNFLVKFVAMAKTIIIGAGGQIGTELTLTLRNKYGKEQVVAADIKPHATPLIQDGPYVQLDILNRQQFIAMKNLDNLADLREFEQ